MKVLKVPDMHCSKCVTRITNALQAEGISFEVDLANKTVSVEEAKVPQAKDALDDIGFAAEEA